jgi:predicted DCC family thiol-disulfide oxidoreductase YuxK
MGISGDAVLLYDGTCGLCCRSVQFVLAHEPAPARSALRFAALEGAYGRALRARHPSLAGVDSVVWYEPHGESLLLKSEAALAVARHLGGVWSALARVAAWVPRRWRDALYDVIARNRRALAPTMCLLPEVAHADRFLNERL